jgi:hypothetical protein
MTEKKVTKKPASKVAVSEKQRELIIKVINLSAEVTRDVMEIGSAYAKDCIDAQRAVEQLAKEMNLTQESYWSKWK